MSSELPVGGTSETIIQAGMPFYTDRYATLHDYYWTPLGTKCGSEMSYSLQGETTVVLQLRDTIGVSVLAPVFERELVAQGTNSTTDTKYELEERDELGRIVCVSGSRTLSPDDIERAAYVVSQKILSDDCGEMAIVEYENPDIADEIADELDVISLVYDSETGLLNTTIVDAYTRNGVQTSMHQNIYNKAGVRTGYIKSAIVNDPDGRPTPVIQEVRVYQIKDGRWQETTYSTYKNGLVPSSVKEGSMETPFYSPDICAYRPPIIPEQQDYYLRSEPEMTVLYTDDESRNRTAGIELPSWIDISSAYAIATGSISLQEASERPYFVDALSVDIIGREEAMQRIGAMGEAEAIQFINQIGNGEVVVLAVGRFRLSRLQGIMRRGNADGRESHEPHTSLSDTQKLALIAALHPAFFRSEIPNTDDPQRRRDRDLLHGLMTILKMNRIDLNRAQMRSRSELGESVNPILFYLKQLSI